MNEQPDGTLMLLKRMGLPVTRENYLRVSFMGNPPEEPLDGEIEAEIETKYHAKFWRLKTGHSSG